MSRVNGRTSASSVLGTMSNEHFSGREIGDLEDLYRPINAEETEEVGLVQEYMCAVAIETYAAAVAQETLLAGYAAEGGMSEDTARAVFEHFTTLAGFSGINPFIDDNGNEILTVESFGDAGGKNAKTLIAVESVRERIKNFWASVVKKFNELWDKLKGFYMTYLDKSGHLISNAEKLKARAQEMSKDGNYKLADVNAVVKATFAIAMSDEQDYKVNVAKLKAGILKLNKVLSKVKPEALDAAVKIKIESVKLIDVSSIEKTKETVAAYITRNAGISGDLSGVIATAFSVTMEEVTDEDSPLKEFGDNYKQASNETFLGMYKICVTAVRQKDSNGAFQRVASFPSYEFAGLKSKEKKRGTSEVTLAHFSLTDIPAICDDVAMCAKTIKSLKMDWGKRNDLAKTYVKELDVLHKKFNSTSSEIKSTNEGMVIAGMFTGAGKSTKLFHEPYAGLQSKTLLTLGNTLDWVKSSLSAHKKD